MNFSVLMSLYIKEKPEYLHECLKSLYEQTKQADEIVLVYDGPITNELDKVVNYWLNSLPIKIIKLSKNVGLGQALNKGLAQCENDYVARMDTDDICHPKRFEIQIDFLNKNKNISVVGSYIEEFSETIENRLSQKIVPTTHNEIMKNIGKRNPFNHMTVVFNKSEIIKVGGYEHHYLMEDYNLWLRLLKNNIQAANLPLTLVYARGGDGMIYRRSGLRYIKSEYKLYKLKQRLGYQNYIISSLVFFLRSVPRVFPPYILKAIYRFLR
ncbi:glycosyltransferase, partial [Escherichia coli]|nr:glycosyltransferase [Escherichia coli]EKA4018715.1 glycosyltransferase [Escherichia coli]